MPPVVPRVVSFGEGRDVKVVGSHIGLYGMLYRGEGRDCKLFLKDFYRRSWRMARRDFEGCTQVRLEIYRHGIAEIAVRLVGLPVV
ncbi:hypothetical protein VTL71DRAFT_4161 [Oculimacula yallundae]|uniref:Uncharacterized protein n=1 Tax=Oculimacula yallundae TaxID=86028 RepID=A0ABR4C519_9HELO